MNNKLSEQSVANTLQAIFAPSHEPIWQEQVAIDWHTQIPVSVSHSSLWLFHKWQHYSYTSSQWFYKNVHLLCNLQNDLTRTIKAQLAQHHRWHCVFTGVHENDKLIQGLCKLEWLCVKDKCNKNNFNGNESAKLPGLLAQIPTSPIAGYELTQYGLVDRQSTVDNSENNNVANNKSNNNKSNNNNNNNNMSTKPRLQQGHILNIHELVDLIQQTQIIEQNVQGNYYTDENAGFIGRMHFGFANTTSVFSVAIGLFFLLYNIPKNFRYTVPRKSLLIQSRADLSLSWFSRVVVQRYYAKAAKHANQLHLSLSPSSPSATRLLSQNEILQHFASRHHLLLRCTNRKVFIKFVASLLFIVFGLLAYSTGSAAQNVAVVQDTQLARAYKQHTHKVLKWLYYILYHHPAYKDDVQQIQQHVQLHMAIEKIYNNSDNNSNNDKYE